MSEKDPTPSSGDSKSDSERAPVGPAEGLPSRIPGPEASLREILSDRRAWIEGMVPPLLFLSTNSLFGLVPAAIISAGWAVSTAVFRLVRRQKASYAIGGIFGLAIALVIALRTGRASTYFLPNVVFGTIYGLIGLASVVIRRPVSAAIVRFIDQKPKDWYALPRVRNTHMVVTAVWSIFLIVRSGIRYYLISIDSETGLAVATIAFGVPATALLFVGSWAFIKRRLSAVPSNVRQAD